MPDPAPPQTEQLHTPTTLLGTVLEVMRQHGVTAVIALGLIWLIAIRIDGKMDRLVDDSASQRTEIRQLVTALQRQASQQEMAVAISQRICLNTAKNDADRLACVFLPK